MGYAEIVEGAERDHRAQKLRRGRAQRQDQIQSAALLQETVLCLFTVVNVLCSIAKRGNKATRQRKRNPNRNQTNRDEMSRERAESNRYGGNEKCPRADD